MFDIGTTEILLITIVALIVIKPQELPNTFRQVGKALGKLKSIGNEVRAAVDDVDVKSKIEQDLAKLDKEFERPSFDFASIESDLSKNNTAEEQPNDNQETKT